MRIRRPNLEWRNAGIAFTWRTAVFIATANKSGPITPDQISTGNGANDGARPAIIFSSGRLNWAKCEWGPTLPISDIVLRRRKKTSQHKQARRRRMPRQALPPDRRWQLHRPGRVDLLRPRLRTPVPQHQASRPEANPPLLHRLRPQM